MPEPSAAHRLTASGSPYLRQHADNPVAWYPWGDEALREARAGERPILLSIGYSACHWCHVMAQESFEDEGTAALMNEHFVCIKVDREQRPDLDRIYQTAHQLLNGQPGGWPLTVFMTPDQKPFFSGTYFPRTARTGLPAFRDVLKHIAGIWANRREEASAQGEALRQAVASLASGSDSEALSPEPLATARRQLAETFDPLHGGFGGPPRFPRPTLLARLLRHYAHSQTGTTPDREALHMACYTLRRMALGGIHDHVGGGFMRYATDHWWMIPHFEKMLGDNALLLGVYAEAWRATGDELYRRVAGETADWMRREMRHPDGGFFTALDADSDGGEGRYYLWTPEQVRATLPPDEADLVMHRFGLDEKPNFEGAWHLHVHTSFSEQAKRLGRPPGDLIETWRRARQRLLEARQQRAGPNRDDKILTAWNALAARALARAGRMLDAEDLIDLAADCLDFLHRELLTPEGWQASWYDGRASLPAYLDDHAFLLAALMEQLQARWDTRWLKRATDLAHVLEARFEDRDNGGFRFTAHDHEPLLFRPREFADDALPSGNAIAASALLQLGRLVAEPRWIEVAERTLAAALPSVRYRAEAHASMLDTLQDWLTPPARVIIQPGREGDAQAWLTAASPRYDPAREVYLLADDAAGALPVADGDERGAWVCLGDRCLPRCDTPQALMDQLRDLPRHPA